MKKIECPIISSSKIYYISQQHVNPEFAYNRPRIKAWRYLTGEAIKMETLP